MLQVLPAPANVAAFHLAGTISAEDYDTLIPEIEAKLAGHEEIGVLADLTGFEGMTAGAMARDLEYNMSKIGELHRFSRAAVISDAQWVETATELADRMFPQIEARVFASDERDAAMDWVAAA